MTIEQTISLAALHEIAHIRLNTKCEDECNDWAWLEYTKYISNNSKINN
ncbi:MAG: hypothetical protein ACXW2E_01995 [Nitrososphaeraceae archaeon]